MRPHYCVVYIYFNWFLPLMGGVTQTCLVEQKNYMVPPFLPAFLAGIFVLLNLLNHENNLTDCWESSSFLGYILDFRRSRAVIRQLIQVSSDILKIKSFGNGISRCFQEVFSTTDAMLFCLHARLGTMLLKCPRRSTTLHGSNVSQI